ncbi:hypothetical protein [Tepidibacillus marianensis]|uniref:hypothetical protein n=1 Tax=Tepidibacillus marianensis TaxID=3131995 RepID=UPI0030D3EE11
MGDGRRSTEGKIHLGLSVLSVDRGFWSRFVSDNGVIIGVGIVLLYGLVSVPYNFHRVGKDAIIYLLNSFAMVIAGMFFYPVVIRLFIKRNWKKVVRK